eukprot:jgi/Mesvir1/13512/Mv06307-RA.1
MGILSATKQLLALVLAVCLMSAIYLYTHRKAQLEKERLLSHHSFQVKKLSLHVDEKEEALKEAHFLLERKADELRALEDNIEILRKQMAELAADHAANREAMHHRDVALRLKEEAEEAHKATLTSVEVCRMEAAVALDAKDKKIAELAATLNLAKQKMDELRRDAALHEGLVRERDAQLQKHALDVHRAHQAVADKNLALGYMATKLHVRAHGGSGGAKGAGGGIVRRHAALLKKKLRR